MPNNPSKEIIEAYSLIKSWGVWIAQKKQDKSIDSEIQELIKRGRGKRKRIEHSRRNKDRLKDMGIILEDTPQGVKWSFRKIKMWHILLVKKNMGEIL